MSARQARDTDDLAPRRADADAALARLRSRLDRLRRRLRAADPLLLISGGALAGALAARTRRPGAAGPGLLGMAVAALLPAGLAWLGEQAAAPPQRDADATTRTAATSTTRTRAPGATSRRRRPRRTDSA